MEMSTYRHTMAIDTSKLIEEQRNYLASSSISVDRLKRALKHKEIVDIVFRSVAYTLGIEDEARRLYLERNYEVTDFDELMRTQRADFLESVKDPIVRVGVIANIASRSWKRSFRRVHTAYTNFNKSSIDPDELATPLGETEKLLRSPSEQVKEDYLPIFNQYRKRQAAQVWKHYGFTQDVEQEVFGEIKTLVKGKEYVSEIEIEVIRFLELEGIERGLKDLYLDLGWKEQYRSLRKLRHLGGEGFNTACYACRKTLHRLDSLHYCKQVENRSCYETRQQVKRNLESEVTYVKSAQKCMKCGRGSNYSHTHKINDVVCYFCSNRCYQAYRKTPKLRK